MMLDYEYEKNIQCRTWWQGRLWPNRRERQAVQIRAQIGSKNRTFD
jgi:hypothetical protein